MSSFESSLHALKDLYTINSDTDAPSDYCDGDGEHHGSVVGGGSAGVPALAVVKCASDITEAVSMRLEQPEATRRAGFAGGVAACAMGHGVMSRVWSELEISVLGVKHCGHASPPAPTPKSNK